MSRDGGEKRVGNNSEVKPLCYTELNKLFCYGTSQSPPILKFVVPFQEGDKACGTFQTFHTF